jgi:hypothetical protein
LSTLSIVWGKWWGAYRTVPLLTILPGLVAAALAFESGRWVGPPLVVGLMLAYGAAISSLGLALATWMRQPGRVLAISVGTYIGITVGAIPVAILLFNHSRSGSQAPCAAMMSPFFGIGFFCAVIDEHTPSEYWPSAPLWAAFWFAEYATAAFWLLVATLLTFDRCLGRISSRPLRRRFGPGTTVMKPEPMLVEESLAGG